MKLPRPSPSLIRLFEAIGPGEQRRMFGCPVSFVNGYMACGVFGDGIFVRLSPQDRARLLALPGAGPFAPMGRAMGELFMLPPLALDDEEEVRRWLERAADYSASLPPKEKKAKRPRAAKVRGTEVRAAAAPAAKGPSKPARR